MLNRDPRDGLWTLRNDLGLEDRQGEPRWLRAGTIARQGSEIMIGRKHLFEPLTARLLVCRDPASFDLDGAMVLLRAGDILDAAHPYVAGHESHFAPVAETYPLPELAAR